jgi:hypothetical protein
MTITRTGTSVRSITARLRPGMNRSRPAAVLMLVVVALVVGLGVRFATPRAAASTGDQTYDSRDFSITLAQDGTVTLLDKQTGTALEGAPDPAAAPMPQDEMRTQAANLSAQVKQNLGWDVTATADRARMLREIKTFHQKLDSIPQAELDLKENAGIRTVRDILENNECRARCLQADQRALIIAGAGVVYMINGLRDALRQSEWPGTGMTTFEAALVTACLALGALIFWSNVSQALADPGMSPEFKLALSVVASLTLSQVARVMVDAMRYAAQSRTTLREESTKTAQAIASLTPDGGPADGYDLVKDEL